MYFKLTRPEKPEEARKRRILTVLDNLNKDELQFVSDMLIKDEENQEDNASSDHDALRISEQILENNPYDNKPVDESVRTSSTFVNGLIS